MIFVLDFFFLPRLVNVIFVEKDINDGLLLQCKNYLPIEKQLTLDNLCDNIYQSKTIFVNALSLPAFFVTQMVKMFSVTFLRLLNLPLEGAYVCFAFSF